MAMLSNKYLVGTTIDDVLNRLDEAKVGYEMTVSLQ
jgi:hypothetical protein